MTDNRETPDPAADDSRPPADEESVPGDEPTADEESTAEQSPDSSPSGPHSKPSRRRFMQATAAASAVVGFTGAASAQDEDDDEDDENGDNEFELGGASDAWVGEAPEDIEGEDNPTLVLEEGESYEVTWENLDGVEHNFVIIDEEGDQIVESELIGEEGETQTVEFEAEEEMSEYYCEPHPQTMRGDISFDEEEEEEEEEDVRYFPEGPTVGVNTVAEGMIAPTDFHDPEGSDYQYVSDQTGEIYLIGDDGIEDEPFLDIGDEMVAVGEEFEGQYADPEGDYDERGLLGLEFHPEYEDNGLFYVSYSAPPDDETPDDWSHVQILSEFEADDDESADPDSERRVLEIQHPQFNQIGRAHV